MDYRLVVPDLRGFGQSDPPAGNYAVEGQARTGRAASASRYVRPKSDPRSAIIVPGRRRDRSVTPERPPPVRERPEMRVSGSSSATVTDDR